MALQQEVIISAKDLTGAGFKSATAEIKKVQNSVNGMSASVNTKLQNTEKAFSGVQGKIASLISPTNIALGTITALATGFGALTASAVKLASQFQQTSIAFETMLGSAEVGQKFLAELANFASNTPFEIPQVEQNAKQLLAMGFAVNEVIPTLTSLGNVAAGLSVPLEQVALAYGQVRAANQLYGSELRQFVQAGVPILDELAKQFDKTKGEIKKMVEQGQISFKDVEKAFQAMSSEGGKFENLMAKQSKSVSGLWSNMKDQLTLIARQLGTPLLQPIAKGLEWLNGKLQNFRVNGVAEFSKMFSQITSNIGIAMSAIHKGFSVLWTVIGPTVTQVWRGLAAAWQGAAVLIRAVLASLQNVWVNWGNTIVSIVKLVWTGISTITRGGAITLEAIGKTLAYVLTGQWANAGNAILTMVRKLWNNVVSLFDAGLQVVVSVMNDMITAFNKVGGDIEPITVSLQKFKFAVDDIAVSVPGVGSATTSAFGEISTAISGSLPSINNTVTSIDDLTQSVGELGDKGGKSAKKVKDETEKLNSTLQDSLQQYRTWKDDVKRSLAELDREHTDKLASISAKITSLNDELASLNQDQAKSIAGINANRAEEVIKQEEKIAAIKKDIEKEILSLSVDEQDALAKKTDLENKLLLLKQKQAEFSDATKASTKLGLAQNIQEIEKQLSAIGANGVSSTRLTELQDELSKEETALSNFNATAVGLDEALAEARRRVNLTDFERFMEDQQVRQDELTNSFNLRKAQIEEELATLEDAKVKEELIYASKREAYLKTQKALDMFRNSVIRSFNLMKDNASTAVDTINAKLQQMENALKKLKDIQAEAANVNISSDATKIEGFAKGGKVSSNNVIMVGEKGPELFVPNSSGNIIPNNQLSAGQSININITGDYYISKEIDATKVKRDIQESIVRSLQLSRQGVPAYF